MSQTFNVTNRNGQSLMQI